MERAEYIFPLRFSEGSINEKYHKGIHNVQVILDVDFHVINIANLFSPTIGAFNRCNSKRITGTNLFSI